MTQIDKRAVLYTRVSSEEQSLTGLSIEAQLRETRDFAQKKEWRVVEEYVDRGYSGRTDKRPEFRRMIKDARGGRFDVLVVHKLDRFSRSVLDILKYWRDLHQDYQIGFVSITEQFDFTTPQGQLQFHIMAAFAEWYSANLSEETKKGKRERAFSGLYNGILPFGYRRKEGSKEAEVVPEEAKGVRLAFEHYATGVYSDQQIGDLLNQAGFQTRRGRLWTKDSLRDFLRNPFYTGRIKFYREYLPGNHEPIISQKLFEKCQQVRVKRRGAPRSYRRIRYHYLLNRLISCNKCNRLLRAQGTKQGHRYYREVSRLRGLHCPDSGKGVRAEVVEVEIRSIFQSLRLPPNWRDYVRESLEDQDQRAQIEARRATLEEKLRRLNRMYADLSIGEMEYDQDREVILAELTVLTLPDETEIVEAGCYLDTPAGIWPKATEGEQSRIVKMVLERVYYDLGELQLVSLVPKPAFLPLFRLTPGIQGVRQREFAPHAGVGGEVVLPEERCSPHMHWEPSSEVRETTEEGSFTRS